MNNKFKEFAIRNVSNDINIKRRSEEEYILKKYHKIKFKIIINYSEINAAILQGYLDIWSGQSYKNFSLILFLDDYSLNQKDTQELKSICESNEKIVLMKCSVVDYIFDKSDLVIFQNSKSKYDDSLLYCITRAYLQSKKRVFSWNTAYSKSIGFGDFFLKKPNLELYTLLEHDYIDGSFAAFGNLINAAKYDLINSEVQLDKLILDLALKFEDEFFNIPVFLEKRECSITIPGSLKGQSYLWKSNFQLDNFKDKKIGDGFSIIISFRDRSQQTIATLKSIFNQNFPFSFELILINNDSNQIALADLNNYLVDCNYKFTIIDYMESFNHSRQCNIGVQAAAYDNILLLNNDVVFNDLECLSELYQHINSRLFSTVGIRVVGDDGALSAAGFRARSGGEIFDSPIESSIDEDFAFINRETLGNGFACVAIRKNLYQKLGGLDEINYPNGYNDVEFCLRAIANGGRHFYLGSVSITHSTGSSRGKSDEIFQKVSLRMHYPFLQLRSFFQLESDQFYSSSKYRYE